MGRMTTLLLSCAVIGSLAGGCYNPKPIPKAYFQGKSQMSVAVGKCPEKAQMSDSGQGGLIGMMVTAGRADAMHEAMGGIMGDTVKELVRQRFSEKMEEYFDVQEDAQLTMAIDILQWGWYVPTTVAGIKTGAYQVIMNGTVTVIDSAQKKGSNIAFLRIRATETIGNKPTATLSQEALLKCADKLAAETVTFLVKERTVQPK